ncbi:MAG: C45 family autoproteolytic acyltransferase/hydrolase [Candidatus Hodarchaeota archaeon]
MEIVILKGTHYEMGLQAGKAMHDSGVDFPKFNQKQIDFALKVKNSIQKVIPEILEEINGIIQGGHYDPETILCCALTVGRSPGCTVMAITNNHTSGGKHFFARNYDGPTNEHFILYKTYPEGRLSHIGCSSLLIGREDGINEAGLAIAMTGVPGRYTNKPGVWDHIPVRIVLERCETVKEAVVLLKEIPHLWAKNFLISDIIGDIAIVEASQQKVVLLNPKNGLGVITNHFQSEGMQEYYNPNFEMHNTHKRLENVKKWFRSHKGTISFPQLKNFLTDIDHGICSNKQTPNPKDAFVTIWSWVTELGRKEIFLDSGTPISGNYSLYKF